MVDMKARFGVISQHLLGLLINHLVTFLSVVFLLCGTVIVALSYMEGIGQYGLGFAFLCAPFGYKLIRKASKDHVVQKDYFETLQPRTNLHLILDICFWALYSISLIILYQSLYLRPWYYFLCVSGAFTILIIQALLVELKSWNIAFYLFKVIFLSLTFRAGRFFAYPVIPGTDTHVHLIWAKYISDFGYIPPFEVADKYSFTPLWHIYEAIHTMMFDVDMSQSLFFLASGMLVAITVLVFAIVKNLFGLRTSLIASVFACLGDMIFIGTTSNINTSLLVMVYFLILIFCLHYTRVAFHGIAIFAVFVLLWTHQLSVFAVFLALFGYYICDKVISSDYFRYDSVSALSKKQVNRLTYINNKFMLFFYIYTIFFWYLIGEDTANGNSFFDNMVSRLVKTIQNMIQEYVSSAEPPTSVYGNLFSNFNFIDSLLYNLGYSMLFCLGLIGTLLVLKYWFNDERVSLLSAMGFLFVVVYPGTFIGLNQLFIPHRFLPFLQLICIIFAAFSLVVLYRSASKRISRIILTLFVFALVFFLITTPYINRNDLIYSKSMESRTELMFSELAGISWGQEVSADNHITVDPHISWVSLLTVDIFHLDPGNITYYMGRDEGSLIYIRSHIRENPNLIVSGTFGKIRMVDCSAYLNDISIRQQLVYDNFQVKIYNIQ